ncbi:MAG: electron transport complex subunit E [Clostridia bacterium]|nr:electron transport complex subunit E [Clostridia bacterium]
MKRSFKQNMIKSGAIVSNGIITNNPVFRLVLGTCPVLAVTTSAVNGLGMGLAATFVLLCSNMLVSALRRVIPDKVRIPAYVLIIATFVTVVQMVLRKFIPSLYDSLGIYLPLIVVNCIILARAEAFASTNPVLDSALDGIGMGLGFTAALMLIGIIREFFGSGSFFFGELAGIKMGWQFSALSDFSMSIFILPAGGFLVFGLLMAAVNALTDYAQKKKDKATQMRKSEIKAKNEIKSEEVAL